jgi:EAL domain-containing protein (putative c-di-GMP-specific phosphodiesterase class I)
MLEQPTFETFYKAKPLKTILSLVKNGSFIDILRFESFTIHFQPIIDKNNNSIFGYESLLRGINPFTNELVSPAFLFDSAREYNMLFFLDRFARELALKSAAVKNIDSHLFINFLPTSIYDPVHCLQSTVKWANQLEFNPKNIVFEVVETEKVEDPIHLKNILDYYKSQGFKTALDDVGSGYSSLSMLASLNPDIIKIDREIIIDIDKNNVKQSICKALVSMANDSGITVLAEGIETRGEYEYLSTLKIDLMQGFFFGKPQAEPLRVLKI